MSKQVMTMGDRVDKWLQDTMPQAEEDGARQDMQLAILKERLRTRKSERQRRRKRLGMAAVPLVVLVVFFGDIVELGGDSFELVEVESRVPDADYTILKNEFHGIGISKPKDDTEEKSLEFTQQFAAREGTTVGVVGVSMNGQTYWSLDVHYDVRGELRIMGETPIDPPSERSRSHLDFILSEAEAVQAAIESGTLEPDGRSTMDFDGVPFALEYWIIASERFGEVTYYSGVPIR